MTVVADAERAARAALTYLVEPADQVAGALLRAYSPEELLTAIKAERPPPDLADRLPALGGHPDAVDAITGAIRRWHARLPELPAPTGRGAGSAGRGPGPGGGAGPDGGATGGARLICPGDPEWPARLDDLEATMPYALWVRGSADLARDSGRSVALVGSRACTGYGAHVAGVLGGELAEAGLTIVSGGAYGIDAAAHRGALYAGVATIAVLACGVDYAYPVGHEELFGAIARNGLIISEWPPGSRPTRLRFLIRNRVIAALTEGTVVVEAGHRSGALNTAHHAAELSRRLMAVPGPVTSEQSAGCHRIIRDWAGTCVTCAADVLELLSPLGTAGGRPPSTGRPRDQLDLIGAKVLDAFPVRGTVGPSTLAVRAGLDLTEVRGSLAQLIAAGFIEPAEDGWRLTRLARE